MQFRTHGVVAVAQLVESRIVIPVVAGSIPVGHPIFLLNSCISYHSLIPSLVASISCIIISFFGSLTA